MGTTPSLVYEISDFKGINLHDEARKIEPGQFTILTNASTDNNSIKADAVDALIQMPIVNELINTIGDYALEKSLPSAVSTATITGAVYITGSFSWGDQINCAVPRILGTASGTRTNIFASSLTLNLDNGSGIPLSASISNQYFTPAITAFGSGITFLGNSGDVYYDVGNTIINNSSVSSVSGMWVKYVGPTASASGITAGVSAKIYSAGSAWVSAPVVWSCVVLQNTQTGGNVLNITPFMTTSNAESTKVWKLAGGGDNDFSYRTPGYRAHPIFNRIYVPSDTDVYKAGYTIEINNPNQYFTYKKIGIATAAGASYTSANGSVAQIYNDFNIVEKGNNVFISCPETGGSIFLDYNQKTKSSCDATYARQTLSRKKEHVFFNGYIVLVRNGSLCSWDTTIANASDSPYALKFIRTCPVISPKIIKSYNNFLMLFNVRDENGYPLFHRVYFSTAGMIDAFSSSQYENMSDGEEILWVEEWYGSLIVFFADRIKRYTGTPGNATLETIFYRGIPCSEVVCKTGRGIFFISTDGLYLYNGTFNRIMDWSTKFDQANSRSLTEDGWLEFNDKEQELYFYPGYDSVVNVWNAKHNFFRQKDYTSAVCTGGMRFFKYYHNMDLKTAISYPSITHVSQVEAGTTYQAVTAQSGWIDVDEGQSRYEQKRFDRVVVEYSGQTTGAIAQVDSITGTPATVVTVIITINNTNITWIIPSSPNMNTVYADALSQINACGEPVTATYVNSGDHSQGIYITANTGGVPFTCTLAGANGTLARNAFTANVTPTDYFNLQINFDDGNSVTQSNIPLFSTASIVSYPIMLNKQAKLVQYKLTAPAQACQLIMHKLKFYYDDVMFK